MTVYYTKTEMRPLINENLKMDTLNYWLKMIEKWTLYEFVFAVPTHSKYYVSGQPKKRIVFDETDIAFLQEVFNLRFNQEKPLAYAIHRVFLTAEDFEKWEKGNWDKEQARQELMKGLGKV